MKIDATSPISFMPEINRMETITKPDMSFASWLTDHVATTNDKLLAADNALQQLASGNAPSLHHTMLTMEEAKLSFQFLEQVRNRVLTAYQDILREQI